MPARALSELEGVVLGIVWKFGPCTPHAIRSHLFSSRSARFSGSAGAIYPLVTRLETRGLLRSRRDALGRQARRLYTTTPAGTRRLQDWLGPRVRAEDVGAVHDPLRVRVYFLAALPISARRRFLDEARDGLQRTLERMQADLAGYRRDGSRLSAVAMQGAIDLTQAQLRWLARSRPALLEAQSDGQASPQEIRTITRTTRGNRASSGPTSSGTTPRTRIGTGSRPRTR